MLVYFHGTPGSRPDVGFGEDLVTELGVRVVSFDRPGHGRSDPSPFGLTRIAEDAEAIADLLGLERLALFGWSGGGPFALAASVVMDERVIRVGVASGPALRCRPPSNYSPMMIGWPCRSFPSTQPVPLRHSAPARKK